MAYAKKARGLMSKFIIKNELKNPTDLIAFNYENYYYSEKLSTANEFTFLRERVS